tara:strand:+ start:1533 stop:2879 length:1347 start_codon:yes stop_codon:yes gene_type:complete
MVSMEMEALLAHRGALVHVDHSHRLERRASDRRIPKLPALHNPLTDVAPSVLLGLPEDMWLHIMQNIDDVELCNEIGRICSATQTTPLGSLCQKDSTYDMLNRKMGLYGDGGTLASMKTWALTDTTPLAQHILATVGGSANFTARRLFEYVCLERKLVIHNMNEYRRDPADRQKQKDYRLNILTLLMYKSPTWGAQAKWVVSLHPLYAFEFIPGSMTTQERHDSLDLQPGLSYDDPVRERARKSYRIIRSKRDNDAATWADIAVPNWVEIAKMAIKNSPFVFDNVPGWVDHDSGVQPFLPCEGFAEIAKLAIEGHPNNFQNVPGSTVNPEMYATQPFLAEPVSNYTELAKLAANSPAIYMLRHVPGSIDPRSGEQLRPPIPDYYDIAEVHLRKRGWSLRYVPPDLPGYAALAMIAINKDFNAFKFVPTNHKDYTEIAAYRDERVAKDQ